MYPDNVIVDVVGTSLINLTCPFCTSSTLHFKSFSCVNVDVVFAVEPEYIAKFDIYISATISPINNNNNQLIGFTYLIKDITEIKYNNVLLEKKVKGG